jgi:hypothetical protein
MASNSASAGKGKLPKTKRDKRVGKEAAGETKAWRAARLQVVREGSPMELRAFLADQEAEGNITRQPDETDFDSNDLENHDAIDSEIDLSDEDDSATDDSALDSRDYRQPSIFPDRMDVATDAGPSLDVRFEVLVHDGNCHVHRPRWMRARPLNEAGQEALDEIGGRFDVIDRAGRWLMEKRQAFLATPDPWMLGVDALEEIKAGICPVTEEGFQKLSGIKTTQFSRYKMHCFLVWQDGSLPLDFLFGPEARIAWVANVVIQRSLDLRDPITVKTLDAIGSLTKPKGTKASDAILFKSFRALGFTEFIQRANLLAGTAWSDVLECHRIDILSSRP